MKIADEMFEELGYKKFNKKHDFENIKYYKDNDNVFYFDETDKSFCKSGEYDEMCDDITMKELQAINKKCKELRLDMMNKCKYLAIRTKNYEKYFYCRLNKKIINYTTEYIKHVKSEPSKNKGINMEGLTEKEVYMKMLESEEK